MGFLLMQPLLPLSSNDFKFSIEKLYFILETEERNLLANLIIEQEHFKAALEAINERSRLHGEVIQPILEKTGFRLEQPYPIDELKEKLGILHFSHIQKITEVVISHVDSTIVNLEKITHELSSYLMKQYPHELILKLPENL